MQDLHNKIDVKRALSPAAATTDNTVFTSQVADLLGYDGAELVILTGSLADADATFTLLIEDSSDNSTFATVGSTLLNGTIAAGSFDFSADDKVFKIGYVGSKRYLRAKITPANNTGNAFVAAAWLLLPNILPPANPPA